MMSVYISFWNMGLEITLHNVLLLICLLRIEMVTEGCMLALLNES